MDIMGWTCGTPGGNKKKCIHGVVGKPEGKGPLGTSRPNWEDNSKMNLTETGWEIVEWINLFQDKDMRQVIVNASMNL